MMVTGEEATRFKEEFSRSPFWAARAPGRVNLIGEHTDYNQGLVLPCAIDRSTLSLVTLREDEEIHAGAWDLAEDRIFSIHDHEMKGEWTDYVKGVVLALAERGLKGPGFDLAVTSSVPVGAGLSSSAALSVSLVAALNGALGFELSNRSCAEIAHRAESHFVGIGCGPLDPLASALGLKGSALRIDCRDSKVEPISIEGEAFQILIFHSGVTRHLAQSFYLERVAECGRALKGAQDSGLLSPERTALSDLALGDLPQLALVLPSLEFKRARHVISENARVEAFCTALRSGDQAALGPLLAQGQASLRDDYEVSIPELDWLCEFTDRLPGVLGSRLTGAGGGGCTLHLVLPASLEEVRSQVAEGFLNRFGRSPESWSVLPADGVRAERVSF
ncbi:MAG: galactokinase [Deltaproteobacteria bacterium]|nr:galactokinase [Deltaproteobacteria bacterium]